MVTRKKKVEERIPATPEIDDVLEAWEAVEEIFSDGKLDPKEFPTLLKAIKVFTGTLTGYLTLLGSIDPKVGAILTVITGALGMLSNSLAERLPELERHYTELAKINADGKITAGEVAPFISNMIGLLKACAGVILPFIPAEQAKSSAVIAVKLASLGKLAMAVEKSPVVKMLLPR
jgi:hypothetical protein